LNIIKELSKRTNIDESRFVINLDKYGNTAGASILIGLDELIDSSQVRHGDLILLVAFGGGLSWGATLIRY
jgi:3-oxoacyl-[acyl-carrier-protein] synthase III